MREEEEGQKAKAHAREAILLCLCLALGLVAARPRPALGEYRVYQYTVQRASLFKADPSSYIVTSALDPVSYLAYHGGAETLKVDLMKTWVCPGHTGGRESYCSPPAAAPRAEGE